MKLGAEDPIQRRRVKVNAGDDSIHSETDLLPCRKPSFAAPVVIRKCDAKARIPDPVHEAQAGACSDPPLCCDL